MIMSIKWMDPHKIDFITIHCTATPEGRDNTVAEVTQWDIDRFGQPSYHYVYELDGDEVQSLRLDQVGAHTGGHNHGNIGLSYVGGTTTLNSGAKPKDTRTDAQKASMEHRIRELLQGYPNAKVRGHHDWPGVQKACPSFNVKEWLQSIGLGSHFG
jgi:N-acetylmuramoyl-L-alanine amidase